MHTRGCTHTAPDMEAEVLRDVSQIRNGPHEGTPIPASSGRQAGASPASHSFAPMKESRATGSVRPAKSIRRTRGQSREGLGEGRRGGGGGGGGGALMRASDRCTTHCLHMVSA